MIFSSLSLNALAKDTDPDYNHGTIKVEVDAVSVQVGDAVNITVSPYVHVQYRGCGRADCPEICGGLTCFEKGLGCGCDKTPEKRTADVKAVSSNEDVIAVDTITPQTEVDENTVGQMADGRLVLRAVGEGTATVTVQASLNDWISAEKTFTITVGQSTDTTDVPDTPQTAELTGIAVTAQPDKTVYTEGESFDPAGMVITASYSDDSEKIVDGYTYAPAGALGANVKAITVSYEENGKTVTASLPVTVESKNLSSDWVDIDDIGGLTDISAKGFIVRHLDADGNVLSQKCFSEDEMRAWAESYTQPFYYTYGCGMQSLPDVSKGEGVQLTDLLETAGIDFKDGQKLMLRASDVLAEDMEIGDVSWMTGDIAFASEEKEALWEEVLADPSKATEDAYYTSFTWDYLMGTERYSFAEGMVKAYTEALENGQTMTQDDLYHSDTVISSGTPVEPLLCFGFGTSYVDEIGSVDEMKHMPMDRGDAYRFCFGQAMDGDAISSANTRFQTAYNVFGIDVVDTEEASVSLSGTAKLGQDMTFTASGLNVSDASTYYGDITKLTLTDAEGKTTELTEDQYTAGRNGIVLAAGAITAAGQYKLTVAADTYEDAVVPFTVYPAGTPVITDFKVTSGEHDDADAELNQTIIATVTFDEAIAVADSEAVKDDLDILISGGSVYDTDRNVTFAVDPKNDHQLVITMVSTDWAAVYNGLLNINEAEGGIRAITSADGSTPAAWTDLETFIPVGIVLDNAQTAGTQDTPASTDVTVSHKANMRGMYHVQVLSNGEPIFDLTSPYYAGTITSHAHNFYSSITPEAIAQAVASAINSSAESQGKEYTAVYNGGNTFTVSADKANAGEVITVRMFEYNEDGRTVDPLLCMAAGSAKDTLNTGIVYTEDSIAAVNSAVSAAEALIGTNPSLQAQADAKAAIASAVAGLERADGLKVTAAFSNDTADKEGTGTVSFAMDNYTSAWGDSVNKITIDGQALASEQYSFTDNGDGMGTLVIDSTVFNGQDRDSYEIAIASPYYETLTDTVNVNNYGADKFYVRYLDGDGNVIKTAEFSKEEMIRMSTEQDKLYNTICGMAGLRSFKASGVKVSDLLEKADIPFEDGMELRLRVNDMAETGNEPVNEDAYMWGSNGRFSYSELMGTARYAFPEIYTNEDLMNTVLDGDNMSEEVLAALGGSAKTEVEPMIAYQYVEKVVKDDPSSLDGEEYSDLISNERAFRFLYGMAMDPENPNAVENATTTWNASYCVFGIDIVNPDYVPETDTPDTPNIPDMPDTPGISDNDTTGPVNVSDNGSADGNGSAFAGTNGTSASNAPQTGDQANPGLWMAIAVLAGALGAVSVYRKKKRI